MAIEPKNIHNSAAAQEPSGNTVRAPRNVPAQVNAPTKVDATPFDATPPKKARRVWRALGIGVLLAACVVGAYGTMTQHGRDTVQAIKSGITIIDVAKTNPDLIFTEANSDHVNILLIGRDVNWKQGKVYDPQTKTYRPFQVQDKESAARSDTMIVMSLDKTRNTIRMVSLPRDAMVHLPPNKYNERRGKLNAAHAFGGPPLLMRTLHDELGLNIHHFAVIKFEGFKNLIDQVGGVDVNVRGALKRDRETGKNYYGNLDYDDNWGNLHIHLKPGMQHLDGQQAHNYVRFRMDEEGDPSRIRRQQDVMRALAKKIMHSSPFQIPGLVKEMRRQFETDLTDEMMGSAAQFARGLNDSAKIQPLTLFGVYGTRGSLTLNKPKNQKLLATIFGSTFNPANFLQHSPTTEDDEIGIANDSNSAAQEVLREAGLLKGPDALVAPLGSDVPTRVEPSREPETSSRTRERRSSSNRRKRLAQEDSRVTPRAGLNVEESDASPTRETTAPNATSDNTSAAASNDSDTPRRRRRRRASSARATSASSGAGETRGESPVPAPEESSTLSVEESPVPRPE